MEQPPGDIAPKDPHGPMENGHAGDANGIAPSAGEEESMEFRILMAYAKRRRPSDKRLQPQSGVATPTAPPTDDSQKSLPSTAPPTDDSQKSSASPTPPKKKKRGLKKVFSCIFPKTKEPDVAPQGSDDDMPQPASLDPPTGHAPRSGAAGRSVSRDGDVIATAVSVEMDEAQEVAARLAMFPPAPLLPGDLETDSPDEDIVQELVKLLRESGDELDKKIKANKALHEQLQRSLSYALFSRVVTAVLQRLNLASLPRGETPQQAKIVTTCDVVTRLSTLDTHPVSQTMRFGERYLKDYFSPWVTTQGGWNQVFNPNCEKQEEDEEEVQ
ncbi:hypothetical protein ACEWY4_002263 [Coilia grayii]|uniref:Apoptosis facilitator Bcl-2-like protein 14 n=1 Tax=Coilia grayii TaxID=363190 RepID=A0ABD1KVC6_9TELE